MQPLEEVRKLVHGPFELQAHLQFFVDQHCRYAASRGSHQVMRVHLLDESGLRCWEPLIRDALLAHALS